MRYRVRKNREIHGERGHLVGGDELPEYWLPSGHLEELIEGGALEEIEDPAAAPQQAAPALRMRAGGFWRRPPPFPIRRASGSL